jgi:hypothetical protein
VLFALCTLVREADRLAALACQVTVNARRVVCGLHKAGGVAITADQLLRCVRIASQQAVALIAALQETVAAHRAARLAGRVRRHREATAAPTPSGFVLGAKLDTDGGGATDVPAYFAGGESDANEDDAGDAAPSWDDVAPAVAFPFAGPLIPAPAGNHDADMEADATGQQHEPVRETWLVCSACGADCVLRLLRRLSCRTRRRQTTRVRRRCLQR